MSLKYYKDFTEPTGSNNVQLSLAYNGNVYAVTSQPRIRLYDQATFENTKVSQSITSGAQGITLITSASAVMCHNSASVTYVELSSLHTTSVTSGAAAAPSSGLNQLAAGNPTSGIAILARSTSGGVIKATSSQVLTALTPAALTGTTATAIVVKDSNWIIGTANGKVMEMDSSGTVSTNITLPATPAIAAQTIQVTGLVYYNDRLLVLTDLGLMFLYQWSTSTLLDTQFTSPTTAYSFSCLTDLASGSAAASWNGSTSAPLSEIYFDAGKIVFEDTIYIPGTIKSLTCDPTTNFVGMGGTSSSFTSYFSAKSSKTDRIQVSTRLQDPAGLDIEGRVIRLRKSKIGSSIVESDTTTTIGSQLINATNSRSYIEIAVRTSPEKFDVREFDA